MPRSRYALTSECAVLRRRKIRETGNEGSGYSFTWFAQENKAIKWAFFVVFAAGMNG